MELPREYQWDQGFRSSLEQLEDLSLKQSGGAKKVRLIGTL